MRTILALLFALAAHPALAHPHVWVTARAVLVFGDDGRLAAVRHAWTFDELTSAPWLDGAAPGGSSPADRLGPVLRDMKSALSASEYYTALRANGAKTTFAEWRNERMSVDGRLVTLHFELPLAGPAPAGRQVVLTVSDPTFFIDFQTAPGEDAVSLEGAPKGCTLLVSRPKPIATPDKPLAESFFQSLANTSSVAGQLASRTTVACP